MPRKLELPKVVVLATGERTLELCRFALESLGFSPPLVIQGDQGFREKLRTFAELAISDVADEFVIKVDADCLCFEGLLSLWEEASKKRRLSWAEGLYYDHFMHRFRLGGPHIYSKWALRLLLEDPSLIPPVQKPEGHLQTQLEKRFPGSSICSGTLTALHDCEQYPSKVANAVLNRITRGDAHYYCSERITFLRHEYQAAFHDGCSRATPKKTELDHLDLTYLDDGFPPLLDRDVSHLYRTYKERADRLREIVEGSMDGRLVRLRADSDALDRLEKVRRWAW
jgi:hypothetical protein